MFGCIYFYILFLFLFFPDCVHLLSSFHIPLKTINSMIASDAKPIIEDSNKDIKKQELEIELCLFRNQKFKLNSAFRR